MERRERRPADSFPAPCTSLCLPVLQVPSKETRQVLAPLESRKCNAHPISLFHCHNHFAFLPGTNEVLRFVSIACETKLLEAVSLSFPSTTTSDDDAERLHGSTASPTASRYACRNVIQWRRGQWWDEQWGERYVVSQCLLFLLCNACGLSLGLLFSCPTIGEVKANSLLQARQRAPRPPTISPHQKQTNPDLMYAVLVNGVSPV